MRARHPSGCPARQPRAPGLRARGYVLRQSGVTLVELIVVMVVLGVLAAFAVPRFTARNDLAQELFADEVLAFIRFSQRSAVAMRRTVCVQFTTTTVTATFAKAAGSTTCDTPLPGPGGEGSYSLTADSAAGFGSAPATITFDTLGRPGASASISVTGSARTIQVEAETGYARI